MNLTRQRHFSFDLLQQHCLCFSPTVEVKTTPSTRRRASTRNKRTKGLSYLYRNEDEMSELLDDDDDDFFPTNFTPFKKQKKH